VHKIAVRLPCLQSAKTILSYKTKISLSPVENLARTLQIENASRFQPGVA